MVAEFFSKIFSSLVWSSSTLFFDMFLSPKESTQRASGFLAVSNFSYTLDKEIIMNRILLCIFPSIPSIPKELILFFSFNRSFKNSSIFLTLFKLFSIGCISQIALRLEGFSQGCNSQTVCLHKIQVPTGAWFKLIFISYNMEPLGFLALFLTLSVQGMRTRWRQKGTRRSSPSLLFTLSITSLLPLSRWRTRLGKKDVWRRFLIFRFLKDLPFFRLESPWISLCSIFEPWEPSSSFSWLLPLY